MLIHCENCGKEFDRCSGEVKRSTKLGRKNYCSLICSGKQNAINLPPPPILGILPKNLNPANRRDILSPFRKHLANAKMHSKKNNRLVLITLEDLKIQWEKQKGICPYTGWLMENAETSGHYLFKHPKRASLDRIDSNKGYIVDNIQFICYMANCAKNMFTELELIEFCKAVSEYRK